MGTPLYFESVRFFMFVVYSNTNKRYSRKTQVQTQFSYNDSCWNLFTDATLIGASLTYIAGLFLLLSFAGPYWIESYPETFSSFKHMGLWEYCFDRFRFPSYQFDKLFHGCHYIFSEVRVVNNNNLYLPYTQDSWHKNRCAR